ncbi:MAG TPA: hypothetical protein VI873_03155 [Candidatus Peribacteraceae bacterium]|nr:hypothetical protein [Candidatus Peribacteraceae bacterium]
MPLPQEMSATGAERLRLLQEWIKADRSIGDFLLNEALRKWRDDVVTRLPPSRPKRILIPELFQTALSLYGPKVVILEDNSVCEYRGRDDSGPRLGRLLVPKKS